MGMGRYQWCIFFLCGFGYFLDLCWAQAFGLVGSAIQQELGVSGECEWPGCVSGLQIGDGADKSQMRISGTSQRRSTRVSPLERSRGVC
jgi:hypothetical protein